MVYINSTVIDSWYLLSYQNKCKVGTFLETKHFVELEQIPDDFVKILELVFEHKISKKITITQMF